MGENNGKTKIVIVSTVDSNKVFSTILGIRDVTEIDIICADNSISEISSDSSFDTTIRCVDNSKLVDKIIDSIISAEGTDIPAFKYYFWRVLSDSQFRLYKKTYFKNLTLWQARIKLLNCCKKIVPFYRDINKFVSIEPSHWADYELETSYQVCRLFKNKTGTEISLELAYYVWKYVSNEVCSRWLYHEDDDKAWSIIISFILTGDHCKEE